MTQEDFDRLAQRRQERDRYKQLIHEREEREPCLGELLYTPQLDRTFRNLSKQLQQQIDQRQPASIALERDLLELLIDLQTRLSTMVCLDIARANESRDRHNRQNSWDGIERRRQSGAAANHASTHVADTSSPPATANAHDLELQDRALSILNQLAQLANRRAPANDELEWALNNATIFLSAEEES